MARPPKAKQDQPADVTVESPGQKPGDFIVARRFGYVLDGKHHIIEAGHVLHYGQDDDLITFLHRQGAELKAL